MSVKKPRKTNAKKAENVVDKDIPSPTYPNDKKAVSSVEMPSDEKKEHPNDQGERNKRSTPQHNTSMKEAPFPGVQLSKEKKAHKRNIREKSESEPPHSNE
ncbi:hypothetical protein [Chromohalobacter israelensis]|uniref:hypothetical protein n=1 Tax=Chromohalobacter israelensis TaxID=141390 RepID=UPI0015C4CB6C|nr:hypothetical protein [Chromohalobacter salexigens]MDO0946876.1 hypothetical protein [Chromohalobacter salexigens]